MNTRLFLLTGILLSGCAGMSTQELEQAQSEGRAHAARLDREWERETREREMAQAREKAKEEKKRKDYLAAIKKLALAIENGEILGSEAFVIKMELDEKTFGPPTPYQKELGLYIIAVAERMEAGEITMAQLKYLIAEKEAEIHAREQQEQAARVAVAQQEHARQQELQLMKIYHAEQQAAAEAAQEAARWENVQRVLQNWNYSQQRVRCTSSLLGGFVNTECY